MIDLENVKVAHKGESIVRSACAAISMIKINEWNSKALILGGII